MDKASFWNKKPQPRHTPIATIYMVVVICSTLLPLVARVWAAASGAWQARQAAKKDQDDANIAAS